MIAIKGMEMPTKCSICPYNAYYKNLGGYICEHIGKITDKDERWEKKLDDCPLVEIVTCKDCKYLCCIEGAPKVLVCEKHNCQQVSKNFYCADGERRK